MKRSYYLLGIVGTIAVVVAVFLFLHYRAGTTTPSGAENATQNVGLPTTPTQSNPTQTSGTTNPSLPGTTGTQTGGAPRFGLVAIDYATQKRTIRPSAEAYREIIRSSEV